MASKSLSKVYFLCGMGRSGTHAIAAWLLPQIRPFVQLDDMNASQPGRKECFSYENYKRIREEVRATGHESHFQMPTTDANGTTYDWNTTEQIRNVNYAVGGWIPFTDQHNLLIHVESVNPQWVGEKIREYKGNEIDYKVIALVRNPFNHMASLWQAPQVMAASDPVDENPRFPPLIKLWKLQTREALNVTTHMGDGDDTNKIICIYDLWFSSTKFRKNLSDQLGVEWNDEGLDKVIIHGESHFHGTQNSTRTWRVLHRYEHYADNADFVSLFDKEVVDLWSQVMERYKEMDVKSCLGNGLDMLSNAGSDNK